MRHCLCLALLAAAALLGSCSSKSNNPGQSGPSVMFWLDSGNLAIESFDSAHPPLGEPVTIDRIISGSNTQLGSSAAAAVLDPAGNRLFVANGTAILVFDNASAANGNQAPARVIQKSGGAFVDVVSLSLDASRDLLYVGDKNVGGAVPSLYVIGNASAANGPVTPASITDNSTSDRRFVFIAANDVLYAAGNCQIAVFDAASTLNGPKAPDRQLDGCAALDSDDHPLWFDAANDDLYVLNASNADPGVMIFHGASTANGSVSPTRTIHGFPLNPGARLRNVSLDTNHDRLYVAATESVFILDAASTLNGTLSPPTFPSQQIGGLLGLDMAAVAVNTGP